MVGDEMGEKVVSVTFREAGKLSAAALKKVLSSVLALVKAGTYRLTPNKTSVSKLERDPSPTQCIEVTKKEMRGFDKYANKYHFEYSMMRQKNDHGLYVLMFNLNDFSKLEMATRDYIKDQSIDNNSLEEKIEHAREKAFNINKAAREKTKEKSKSKGRSRSVER